MARPKAKSTATYSVQHQETRLNIPTRETSGLVPDDDAHSKSMRYPRDPALDPQLVWMGKDEQDQADLEVPVVPIYIQEKIHPQAIIEELARQRGRARDDEDQLSFFADFDGLEDFEQKVDFYHHQQNWSNRMILGDSLLVMSSLAEKEGLKGKVQTIYLDPPYGIKFGSNWQVSTRKRDVKDGRAEDVCRQPEQVCAFRDTWKLGVHSYLAYLRERLVLARELLTETGSIFLQIGEENVHLVRCLLDEVFGSPNSCGLFAVRKTSARSSELVGAVADYIIWFAKDKNAVKFHTLWQPRGITGELTDQYGLVEIDGDYHHLTSDERRNPRLLPPHARLFRPVLLTSSHEYSLGKLPFVYNGETYLPGNRYWSTSPEGLQRLAAAERLWPVGKGLNFTRYLDDFAFMPLTNMWTDTATGGGSDKYYVVQTTTKIIERCILMTTDPGDLVLDPTCGSGTTAYVAEQWGRRWITIDTSRVALALARTRLMAARYPYYLLQDSPEGQAKETEISGQVPPTYNTGDDIRKGFVYKRVPHVTLKSIANNPEIDGIHHSFQPGLEGLLDTLNTLLSTTWQEWQVPRAADSKWPVTVGDVLADYWKLRQQRQQAIDAAIARHADTETLYDQPYEDNKRVRVSGPFTVESLSPHRMLPTDDEAPANTNNEAKGDDFVTMILENLKKAGIQNTRKQERLKFNWLESFAAKSLQAIGEFAEADGSPKRVAISIGPEFGTVGPELIREAVKEAMKGIGVDLLIVCGFAFDAHASETAKEFSPVDVPQSGIVAEKRVQYGKLPVLLARMNPDLAMGDELLKKTGAGNLFMVFGEPDVEIHHHADAQVAVQIRGVDIYDPTTSEVRSNSTDEIACWFIDTDYNEESFFVRHAYFTGAEEPYDKLKRALRAEVDEAAWSSLYSTTSRPFPLPQSKKIAVKVINHYGDEVLKVYSV